MHEKKLYPVMAGGETTPEGVEFGAGDFVYRSSSLIGDVATKEITYSDFFYYTGGTLHLIKMDELTQTRLHVQVTSTQIRVYGYDTSNNKNLDFTVNVGADSLKNTVTHLLFSVDMTSTGNRHVYINDLAVSPLWTTYINGYIAQDSTSIYIGALTNGTQAAACKRAHTALTYGFYDISIVANRRLFITEDGFPALGLISLNPIIYLPNRSPETAHENKGAGGEFSASGELGLPIVGINEWQCVASEFDGSSDYLSKSGLSITGRQLVLSFTSRPESGAATQYFMYSASGGYNLQVQTYLSGLMQIKAYGVSNTLNLGIDINDYIFFGSQHHVCISVDLTDQSKTRVIVDGTSALFTVTSFKNEDFKMFAQAFISSTNTTRYSNNIGELYFDIAYIDLVENNPFWDANKNRPNPVRQVLEETGNTPLIAMPIRAGNEGVNYGLIGNFTVNSGSFKGARGASEYWARSAKGDGSTGYFGRYISTVNPRKISVFLAFKSITNYSRSVLDWLASSSNEIRFSAGKMRIELKGTGGGSFVVESLVTKNDNNWHVVMLSLDTDDVTNRVLVYDESIGSSLLSTTISGQDINLSGWVNLPEISSSTPFDLASYYVCYGQKIAFDNDSIRSQFIDQLGYPKDLTPAIESGEIPQPLFYLKFDDPDDLGLDSSGNNNHFTINGNVTQGADFHV
jgi:hypothetical protein